MSNLISNKPRGVIVPEKSNLMASHIAVVIPCYKVRRHILDVIKSVGEEVDRIYVVDDACPEGTGKYVEEFNLDQRVSILYQHDNQGVGGAVLVGYQAAICGGAEIIVKIDGDGQMDARLLPLFIAPILAGEADDTKGNRFYNLEEIRTMPNTRLFGNAVLSFMAKLSTGYWDSFDPTNGYTAIHANVAQKLPVSKISKRYFFETDILFRLNTLRAVVVDIPMDAKYGDEISNLKISKIAGEFLVKHIINFFKRIFYNYYLRDLSIASIELPLGVLLLSSGLSFGLFRWYQGAIEGITSSAGTVMLAAMPMIMGVQFILAFLGYDISSVPNKPRHIGISIQNQLIKKVGQKK